MIFGNPGLWSSQLKQVDEQLLTKISLAWKKCVILFDATSKEDFITRNLVNELRKDREIRQLVYLDYQYVPFDLADKKGVKEKGYIDFAAILDNDRETYVAYECKRLNVPRGKTKASLSTEYVNEGIMRYVNEQYSERLPFACMLGYVIDGNTTSAMNKLALAISKNKSKLKLISGPDTATSAKHKLSMFTTTHSRRTHPIEVKHALLPII